MSRPAFADLETDPSSSSTLAKILLTRIQAERLSKDPGLEQASPGVREAVVDALTALKRAENLARDTARPSSILRECDHPRRSRT